MNSGAICSGRASRERPRYLARAFVDILLKGRSKVTREELAQIPADRKAAFINEVAMRLRDYETSNALTLPMESRALGRSEQAAPEHPRDWHCGCDRHRRHCHGPEGFSIGS